MKPTPPWSILKQPERYVPAARSDIRATFKRLGFVPPSERKVIPLAARRKS